MSFFNSNGSFWTELIFLRIQTYIICWSTLIKTYCEKCYTWINFFFANPTILTWQIFNFNQISKTNSDKTDKLIQSFEQRQKPSIMQSTKNIKVLKWYIQTCLVRFRLLILLLLPHLFVKTNDERWLKRDFSLPFVQVNKKHENSPSPLDCWCMLPSF